MGDIPLFSRTLGSSPGKHEQGATVGALFVGKPILLLAIALKTLSPFCRQPGIPSTT